MGVDINPDSLLSHLSPLRPGHTGPNGWIAYGSRTNPDFVRVLRDLEGLCVVVRDM